MSRVGIEPTTRRLRERVATVRRFPRDVFLPETGICTVGSSARFRERPPVSVSVSVSHAARFVSEASCALGKLLNPTGSVPSDRLPDCWMVNTKRCGVAVQTQQAGSRDH